MSVSARRLLGLSLASVLVVDVPLLVAGAAAGAVYGYRDTIAAVLDWRQQHPATYLLSAAVVAAALWRRRSR